MNLQQMVERQAVIDAAEPINTIKQRVAQLAASLDRAGTVQQRVLHANTAIMNLAELCYRQVDGYLINVDQVTTRVLIAKPWGNDGWRVWGLRKHEGATLRRVLLTRQRQKRARPPLFLYDAEMNDWLLNLYDYATLVDAQFWIRAEAVTYREWRQATQQAQQQATQRATSGYTKQYANGNPGSKSQQPK